MGLKGFVILAVMLALIAAALTPNYVGFTYVGASPLNPGWDGTTHLVKLLKQYFSGVRIVTRWAGAELPKPARGSCNVIFLVSPTKPLSGVEARAIASAVRKGYSLVIADEGVYSNAVLAELNAPIRIAGDVITVNGSPSITIAFRVGGTPVLLRLFYASHLRVWDGAKVLAYAGGGAVAAEFTVGGARVVVVGDGTPLINDALISARTLNPYVRFVRALILAACGRHRPRYAVVDGAPYALKPASLTSLLREGYPIPYIAASLLNPYRYYFGVRSLAGGVPKQLKPLLVTAVVAASLAAASLLIGKLMAGMPKAVLPARRRAIWPKGLTHVGVKVMRKACRDVEFAAIAGELCEAIGRVKPDKLDVILRKYLSDPRVREALLRAVVSLRGSTY